MQMFSRACQLNNDCLKFLHSKRSKSHQVHSNILTIYILTVKQFCYPFLKTHTKLPRYIVSVICCYCTSVAFRATSIMLEWPNCRQTTLLSDQLRSRQERVFCPCKSKLISRQLCSTKAKVRGHSLGHKNRGSTKMYCVIRIIRFVCFDTITWSCALYSCACPVVVRVFWSYSEMPFVFVEKHLSCLKLSFRKSA